MTADDAAAKYVLLFNHGHNFIHTPTLRMMGAGKEAP